MIRECPYAIHDLSRIELDPVNHLPRFNMALELGIFLGTKLFSENKKCLVMETEQHRYETCAPTLAVSISCHTEEGSWDSSVPCVTF